MKNILHKFITESLFDASASLLDHFKIRFTAQTKTPISFAELYSSATSSPTPQSLADVVGKITHTFIIGNIDEESLQGSQSSYEFGKPIDGKYQTMLVFAVDVKQGESLTRSELATLTRGFNRMADSLPVIIFIKNGNYLSLATCERSQYSQQWREGEKLGKVSILRDINCLNPHRGHIDILESIGDKAYPTFDELYAHWLAVFSSELLTKKFYTELSEWYAWVIGSGEVKFPNDITTTDDDMKYNHEAVIRLITRLIFVWFLRQKKLVPEGLFDEQFVRNNFIENFDPHATNTLFYNPAESKYYRLILQNLFFAMLNRPIVDEETGADENRRFVTEKRFRGANPDYNINNLMRYRAEFRPGGADKLLEIANAQIPFLNGGLFECLDDKDSGKYFDGFSERKASLEQLSFPDYFFFSKDGDFTADLSEWYDDKKKKSVKVRGLINILKRYSFTVEENTPLDQEVSLDPELLGKVFENLLASYNPETNTSARKQTGSFYTPREIVKYMVDESLIAHLHRKCPDMDEAIFRHLLSYSTDNYDLSETDRKRIIQALYECKILDPACGSGAFPMGMLQQMVHALRKLDPTNELWREFILELSLKRDKEAYSIEDEEERRRLRNDIEQSFNRNVNDPDYARKLYLIENCIYGVDIQPIAVQISKLRFFISLVAEQKPTADAASNFGIRPLPNLEAKFVAANTLIPLEKEQNLFGASEELTKLKDKLSQLNHKLFLARRNAQKKKLREEISNIRKQYNEELLSIGTIGPSSANLIASWDMFGQNSSASFFDAEWMFDVVNGFDIIIGNPPYIQLQNNGGFLAKLYEKSKFNTFARTGDIYCLFYEQGWRMLAPGGLLCYITSNKWMRAEYGKRLREFLSIHTNPRILVDFGGVQVFESATVDTNILLYSKESNGHETKAVTIDKSAVKGFVNLSDFVQQNASAVNFDTSESWVILTPIEQSIKRKIEAVGVPLKDWDIQINYGIKTGFNDAFIISTETRNQILANCADEAERERTAELIRPILRGRDIKRYGYEWADKWVILAYYGSYKVIPTLYPAIYKHLLKYETQLKNRGQVRYTSSGKTRSKDFDYPGQHHWLELDNNPGKKYLDDFSKPKIVYQEICRGGCGFAFDDEFHMVGNTAYILTANDRSILDVLLKFLNSPYALYQLDQVSTKFDETGWRWLRQCIEQIKLPINTIDWLTAFNFTDDEKFFITQQYNQFHLD